MPITPYALQVKTLDVGNMINNLNAMRQSAQQQQMNALAMEKAQREASQSEAFKNALATGQYKTPEGMNKLMGIDPTSALALRKMLAEEQQIKKSALKTDLDLFSKAAGSVPDTAENYSFLYKGALGDNPDLASYLPHPDQYKPGLMQQFAVGAEALYKRATTESANQARLNAANIRAEATRAAAERAAARPFEIDGKLISPSGKELYTSVTTEKAPTSVQEYNFFAEQEKQAGRPVKSYEQWATAKTAPASKVLTPAQEVKLGQDIGKDYKNLSFLFEGLENVIDASSKVREAPGLKRATGYGSYLLSLPEGEAAAAETRIANLKGKITSLGKNINAMSGAMGSMATQEWKILRDTVSALDDAVKAGESVTKEQLDEIESYARGFKDRAIDAYQKQYGDYFDRFPQFKELPAFKGDKQKPGKLPKKAIEMGVTEAEFNAMSPDEQALFNDGE